MAIKFRIGTNEWNEPFILTNGAVEVLLKNGSIVECVLDIDILWSKVILTRNDTKEEIDLATIKLWRFI